MIIDTDVHVNPTAKTLDPYMTGHNAEDYLGLRHPKTHINVGLGYRGDIQTPGNAPAGSDLAFMSEDLFDRHRIDLGLCTPWTALEIGEVPDLDLAADYAQALNQWQVEEALPVDDRYVGSIVVAPGDPERAADEIRKWGAHPRMVQVYTSILPCLMGQRFLHPIYEACDEHELPFTLHVGGSSTSSVSKLVVGAPETFFEHRTAMCLSAISHLISVVSNGVFVKYPRFRCVFSEFGTGWLPWVIWRMDMEYRGNREDVPWLVRKPSDYIYESVRFTTQPFEESTRPRDMITLLELVAGDRLLMYSSDYPHFDFDDPETVRRRLPEAWRDPIMFKNATEFFKLEQVIPAPLTSSTP